MSLADAGAQTLAFLQEHISEPRSVPLCGNSIGTDRRFLAIHLPEIEQFLHYRSVDVTSVKELIKRWNPTLLDGSPSKSQGHRAMDDIRESLEELRFYRDRAFVLPTPTDSTATDGNATGATGSVGTKPEGTAADGTTPSAERSSVIGADTTPGSATG